MSYKELSSASNPKILLYKKLNSSKQFREKQGKIALEGPNLIREALKKGLQPEFIFFTTGYPESAGGSWVKEVPPSTRLYQVNEQLFNKIALTEKPQPVAAVFYYNPLESPDHGVIKQELIILLEELQDPGNLGTIIRTAAAAGADTIYYTGGCADPFGPKALRASAGSIFSLKVEFVHQPLRLICSLKEKGLTAIAAVAHGGMAYYDADFRRPVVLFIGNEAGGLSPELAEAANYKVTIPLQSNVESLNAAVAAGIILFEIANRDS